ncbi:flagellar filament capping protein FliD [Sphingomonas faeni]|uniref:flagellar filament capping protein FliD n=1 Tax=Sphingomonas faeni TaxID=185950 RepID=UPI0033643CF0
MVTSTTSATATPTPTTTSGKTAVNTATQSLLTALNAGSGVDTGTLVSSLVEAQFAARTATLKSQTDALTAQISGISTIKSTITGFSTALETLVKSGSLQTQPISSSTATVSATALSGAKLANLSASVTVKRLATAQASSSIEPFPSRTAPLGTGKLTLTIGTKTYQDADGTVWDGGIDGKAYTFDVGRGSLDEIAAAINGQRTGVTASIVTDSTGGAYLSVKGTTGVTQAFTMTSENGNALDIGQGSAAMQTTAEAGNAQLMVDGIAVERSSNIVSDLVDGVKLQLNAVSTSPVSLTSTTPTDALTQAVTDVIETYNQVLAAITEQTDPKTGTLRSDPAAASLLKSLKALTSKALVGGAVSGIPRTLAEIGVATNNDGTLRVDSKLLAKQVAANPDTIEAMFAPSGSNVLGLSATLSALTTSATSVATGLGASTARYTAAVSDIAKQQDKVTDQSAQLSTRLTQQYASLNSRLSAYKSTQTFLTNQIAAWNKSS